MCCINSLILFLYFLISSSICACEYFLSVGMDSINCFNEIPIATRIEYEKCIKSVKKWADRILETINQEKEIIDL